MKKFNHLIDPLIFEGVVYLMLFSDQGYQKSRDVNLVTRCQFRQLLFIIASHGNGNKFLLITVSERYHLSPGHRSVHTT